MSTAKIFEDLLSTDYGLGSLAVIVIVIIMAIWFIRFFVHKMNQKPGSK